MKRQQTARSARNLAREADLFFADLLGVAPTRGAALHAREDAPTPASAASAADLAVSEALALLVADRAPLPITPAEARRVASDAGARADYKSVCAAVPTTVEPRTLLFFHGNNGYVTVAPRGDVPADVDPSGHSRAPRWADARGRTRGRGKRAAALAYGLDALAQGQSALDALLPALSSRPARDPVVLVPEDAEHAAGSYWSVPPRGQYATARGAPPSTRLGELVDECHARLRRLARPSGRPYLSASEPGEPARLYVAGHSGGGKPLLEAASSALLQPSGRRGVDLWLFDCTYGWGTDTYLGWCRAYHAAGRLAQRPDGARLVCVYRAGPGTEAEADQLRGALARLLGVTASSLLVRHDGATLRAAATARDVVPALTTSPVVFVRTEAGHDAIPRLFTPLLLRTAAS